MIRINLLPPEIVEKRKYERFYPFVLIVAGLLVGIVLVVWVGLTLAVGASESELQQIEQSAADVMAQAERLRVFELREQELAARQQVAAKAVAGRIDMGRLAEELSLVLPEEVWAATLSCDESDGLRTTMFAPEPLGNAAAEGYKAVASTLVRLASLETVYDVWLGQAAVSSFNLYQGIEQQGSEAPAAQVVSFDVTAKIRSDASALGTGE